MKSRYVVTLNNKSLASVDSNLLVLDVSYGGIKKKTQELIIAGLDGFDLSDTYVDKQIVTITFELHIYDIVKRNKACQAVIDWAKDGGDLKINDRADQYLKVRCESFPVIDSMKDWTAPLSVTFSTVSIPYWRSTVKNSLTLSGTQPSGTLKVTGNAGPTVVVATITAKASITSLSIICGSSKIEFKKDTGFAMSNGQILKITYVNDRFISIKVGSTSYMKHLQATSTDRLLATSGSNNTVQVKANGKVSATLQAEGLWL